MTSQTFSDKPVNRETATSQRKHVGLYAFISSFGAGIVALNVIALLFILFIPPVFKDSLVDMRAANPDLLYVLIPSIKMGVLFLSLVAQAMVTALFMFAFMLNKRSSGTYLALPIKRGHLFAVRYAAGLIMILLPIFMYLTLMLYYNISVFGYSSTLMQGYWLMLLGLWGLLLTFYSITSAVCLSVGTWAEGLSFSLILLFGWIFLGYGVNFLFQSFLYGNVFGEWTSAYYVIAQNMANYVVVYSPGTYAMIFLSKYSTMSRLSAQAFFPVPFWGEHFDGLVLLLSWCLLSVGISGLAYWRFKRYKAEHSGLLGTHHGLNFFCTFTIVSFVFCMFSVVNAAIELKILFALAAPLVMFIICRFLLTLSLKKAFAVKGFKQLAAILSVCGLMVGLCLTGWFGYTAYQPTISAIDRAFITYTGAPDFIMDEDFETLSYETGNYYTYNKEPGEPDIVTRIFTDLVYTSEKDIQTVLDLHQSIIQAGADYVGSGEQRIVNKEKDRLTLKLHIRYELKNGKAVDRIYHNLPASVAEELPRLDETDAVKERVSHATQLHRQYDDMLEVTITDSLFNNEQVLDTADNLAFFEALQQDIDQLPLSEKYHPETLPHAVVTFQRLYLDEDGVPQIDSGAGSVLVYTQTLLQSSSIFYGGDGLADYGGSTGNIRIFLTDSYVNTLAFLKDRGLWETTHDESSGLPNGVIDLSAIEAMHIERYRVKPVYETQAPYFRAYLSHIYQPHKASLAVEPGQYENIIKLARTHYYLSEGGYLIKIKTPSSEENGMLENWVTLFLPEADAPAFVTDRIK